MTELVRHPALPKIPDTIERDQRKWAKDLLDFVKKQAEAVYDQQYHDDLVVKGPWVDIRAYGANKDAADNTGAIQDAFDSGSYNILIPDGTFITGKLTAPTQIHIRGMHQTRSALKLKDGTDDHLLSLATKQWVAISDLTLDGNSANNAATSNGLNAASSASVTLERVRITDFNDYAAYLDTCNDVTFYRCWLESSTYGFYATSSEQCNLEKCVIQENATYGVQYVSALVGAVNIVNGCWFENPTVTPTDYIIIDSDNLNIQANKFNINNCSNSAIRVKTGACHNWIVNNVMHQTGPTYTIVFDSGAKYNFSIGNWGGSPVTTDNDGENYILETNVPSSFSMWQRGRVVHNMLALADEATPSVKLGNHFYTSGTANDPITDFDDGQNGQPIEIVIRHTVQFTHDVTKLVLLGAANVTLYAGDTITFLRDNNVWKQTGGSDNT